LTVETGNGIIFTDMVKSQTGKRVALDSIGCKLNQAEIEALSWQLTEAGYTIVGADAEADIYVLNTCTVTGIADRKSRHLLRMARRRNPQASLVAIGCYATRAPDVLRETTGADLILGNTDKERLPELLGEIDKAIKPESTPLAGRRTRAFIKIQDGCHNFCAYCIVPLVRSREESAPLKQVINEIKARQAGYKEVVLTGTEVGTYNSQGIELKGLLEHILRETDLDRIRLSSLQPQEISPELIGLWQDRRLCPHFHISLQSGSDSVLKRMKRRYNTAEYKRAISIIREAVSDVSITTDIIVGFPGETDAEFRESFNFCRETEFARIHVFPYSPRPGTEAAKMKSIDNKFKKQRSQEMLELAQQSLKHYNGSFTGRIMDILWEQKVKGIWSGLTGNYIRVYAESDEDLSNRLIPVRLGGVYKDGLWAEAQNGEGTRLEY
jgi:threonylcarbamoyladenosine tRNA methylthiotransferase MtaB